MRQGGDEFVAGLGLAAGGAGDSQAERGKNQQPAGVDRRSPEARQPRVSQALGRANDDGLLAAQQEIQALLFHRRIARVVP